MNCSTPGLLFITISRSSLRLTSIESVMPSSHLIVSRLLGSSPGGSRVIRRWWWNRHPRKNLNYRFIERLETDSVVGKSVEKRGWITWFTWNSIHAPDGNSARKTGSKKETTWGNQSFQKLILFLYFSDLLIYFLLYTGMNTESLGGQQTWPLSQSGASYKIIQRS